MTDLTINSVVPTADENGLKTASVVSSWGNAAVTYQVDDHGINITVDFKQLSFPVEMPIAAAGPRWVNEVTKAIKALPATG